MIRDEVRAVLLTRRELTGESFNDRTLDAWLVMLGDWEHDEADRALHELVFAGYQRVAVAQLVGWRHDQRARAEREQSMNRGRPIRHCGCPLLFDALGALLFCDHERGTGLDAIARIRAEREAARTRHPSTQEV